MLNFLRKFKIDNRVGLGYLIGFFLLLLSYLIALYTNKQLIRQAKMVSATNAKLGTLETLISKIKDGETSFRGFCVMKDRLFLEPYYTSMREVPGLYRQLRKMAVDTDELNKLDTLNEMIRRKYEIMSWGIEQFTGNNYELTDSMKIVAYRGKAVMDSARSIVNNIQQKETKILTQRDVALAARFRALDFFTITSLIIAFLMIAYTLVFFIRENRSRLNADRKVEQYQQELRKRIDELATANKELLQMRSQEKFAATGRIARTIAHEVRNPLTNINLAVEQIKTGSDQNEDDMMLFDMILRNSSRINQLISDLLQSTKFAELNYSRRSVNTVLDDVLAMAADRIALNKIIVVKEYSNDICDINVDAEKIKIAFLNLVVNAIEAMVPGEGVLTLRTRQEDKRCVVEISDNGSGMDQESLQKLFEPYFTKKQKGTGLGLTNTQNIILNHKGLIKVDSEPGKGTTFTIYLDVA